MSPSRASQVLLQTSIPGVAMVREHQPPPRRVGGPARSQCAASARQAPQVVWREKKKGRSAARQAESSRTSGSHLLPAPGHSVPIPSPLPAGGMTPQPERPCSHSRVGERAPTNAHRGDIATRARAPWVGGTPGAGGRGGAGNLGRQVWRRPARAACT